MSTPAHETIIIEDVPEVKKEVVGDPILYSMDPVTPLKDTTAHSGCPIIKCAISPLGSCIATYSAESESVVIWSIEDGKERIVKLFETTVATEKGVLPELLVSDKQSFMFNSGKDANLSWYFVNDIRISKEPFMKLPDYVLRIRPSYREAFLSSGELVVVAAMYKDDVGFYRFKDKNRKWERRNASLLDWTHETEYKHVKDRSRERFRYFIIKDKLVCQYDGHLTQWDIYTSKLEVQYFCDDISVTHVDLMNDVTKFLFAVDPSNLLSALVTGKPNSQKLTVYWIKTEMPLNTTYVTTRNGEQIVAVDFIRDEDCCILVMITDMGTAILWDPFDESEKQTEAVESKNKGNPLETIDLSEHILLGSWKPGLNFVLNGHVLVVIDNGQPLSIPIIQQSFQKIQKSLLTVIPSATMIRALAHEDAKLEPLDRKGRRLEGLKRSWHVTANSGISAYQNKTDKYPASVHALKYFGSTRSCTILSNDDLAILCDRGVCIFYLSDEIIHMRYFWDDDIGYGMDVCLVADEVAERILQKFDSVFWPPPSTKTIWWHVQKTLEARSPDCQRAFDVLYKRMTNSTNLVFYGKEILCSIIVLNDGIMVENILEACFCQLYTYSITHIAYMGVITPSLPQISELFSDMVFSLFPKSMLVLDPNCEFVNRLPITPSHLYAFTSKFHSQNALTCSVNLRLRLELLEDDIKEMSRFRIFWVRKFFRILAVLKTTSHVLYKPYLTAHKYFIHGTRRSTLTFIVPLPKYCTYPENYSFWQDAIFPVSSPFVTGTSNNKSVFYQTWDGEAIINFKWKTFVSHTEEFIQDDHRRRLLYTTVVIGCWHIHFELRQFIWSPSRYITSLWNWIDCGAYGLPLVTTFYLLCNVTAPEWVSPIAALLLWTKLLVLLRPFEYFGIYIAIMIGVAQQVFSFLIVLGIMILGFAHAFFILLKPQPGASVDTPPSLNDNDPNNPWKLTATFNTVNNDGSINSQSAFLETPGDNTNVYSHFSTALWGTYMVLTGDLSSFSGWNIKGNPTLALLIVSFSFFTVIYLLNLFIGLLSNAIDLYHERGSYLAQKAEVLAEIELFYMFPSQRRNKCWFPDTVYYEADVKELRKLIKGNIDSYSNYLEKSPIHAKRVASLVSIGNTGQMNQGFTL
ncbi:7134_t:CDS:2 [Paraglomus brasilianum]|uniref:7134_t:CDS:1 n=1 Tax=Paraglomus brasilianum TaxID=144538 RepID=A0A9N8WE24_9GLOM|nr:7134_t:CDS:2 [Paraglomus brasilianum]